MPELLSPALILFVAAVAIGFTRGQLHTALVLLAPLLTLWAVWQVPDGVQGTVGFFPTRSSRWRAVRCAACLPRCSP